MTPPRPSHIRLLSTPSWQQALSSAVRDIGELASLLELPPDALGMQPAADEFPLLVPRGFVRRMRKGDPNDPLLRQVLPLPIEREPVPGFSADPLHEAVTAEAGVLRKYPGRALLITTSACPVHCRYCFRRAFPYRDQLASRNAWAHALAALQGSDTTEVILSGGDPLSLSNTKLETLLRMLEDVESVRTLRIHTRFPIIVPERVDADLLAVLRSTRFATVVVVHCNHANEIDQQVASSLLALKDAVAVLLNQSVLLAGVNDEASRLIDLSQRLFASGVLPYYLHLLDPVAGAAHFNVDEERARALLAQVRAALPGYLVPRLVKETPGRLSKTPIA